MQEPTASGQPATSRRPGWTDSEDGWTLPDESPVRPQLVTDFVAPSRQLSMAEIDDGWFLEEEASAAPAEAAPAEAAPALVDVNTAEFDTLRDLPGIGRLRARRIIAEREREPFASVDDLTRVKGIGPKTLEQLRTVVTVA